MEIRGFWVRRIEGAWKRRSIVWVSGVRRAGKTTLCRNLQNIQYFDCELPRVRRIMENDPQEFLESLKGKKAVLDEIHRLENPSELLKIAADHYPEVKLIATGSSSLSASKKFKDTLTGRKAEVWLTPMNQGDLANFGSSDLKKRLLRGGLPEFFLQKDFPEGEFQEWMDAYWAKDIQELFRLERRHSFQKFFELLLAASGGIFEASRYAINCEVSRGTIVNYLTVLEATYVVHVTRPYSTHRPTEIVSAPKVYGFDTGFVCYHKGWHDLRNEDLGSLWEHYVLNEIHSSLQSRKVQYWRDKRGHEVDFIWAPRGQDPIAIECKWSASGFNPANLHVFRKQYPQGVNYVVSQDIDRKFQQNYGDLKVQFTPLSHLIQSL